LDKLTHILAVADASASGLQVVEKAVLLAERFGARVDLVSADAPMVSALAASRAKHRYDAITISRLHGSGSLQEQVVQRARETRPDLVIKAASGARPLRRWSLDETDRWLASECPVPLLLSTARPWVGDLRMAAAVDVSNPDSARFARSILQCAGFLALGSSAWLDVLYSETEERDERVRMERAVKLSQLVREFHVGCERLQMFGGPPERTLPRIIESRRYELLVLGAITHRNGIGGWRETLSSKLVDATPGDVLLVKPEERRVENVCPVYLLLRQQGTHLAEQLV
jgi:nucleotide-binding universal stress UspA family protein